MFLFVLRLPPFWRVSRDMQNQAMDRWGVGDARSPGQGPPEAFAT